MPEMINTGRSAPRETDKAETAKNALGAMKTCKILLVAETILERDQRCLLAEEGREQPFQ